MRRLSTVISTLALLAAPAILSAATVSATLTGVGLNQIVSVNYNNVNHNVFSGRLAWSAPPNAFVPQAFETFCIEFTQNISFNQTVVYDVVNDIGQAPFPYVPPTGNGVGGMETVNGLLTTRNKETLLRQLWGKYYNETHDGLSTSDINGSYNDSVETAAFQVAIWKTLYETSQVNSDQASLASGVFKLNNGGLVGARASTYLGWLRTNDAAPMANGLFALSSATAQDQLYFDGTTTTTATVPLPASVLSGGALFIALGAMKYLRNRRR